MIKIRIESDFLNVTKEFAKDNQALKFLNGVKKIIDASAGSKARKEWENKFGHKDRFVSAGWGVKPKDRLQSYVKANAKCHSEPVKIFIDHE